MPRGSIYAASARSLCARPPRYPPPLSPRVFSPVLPYGIWPRIPTLSHQLNTRVKWRELLYLVLLRHRQSNTPPQMRKEVRAYAVGGQKSLILCAG